MVVGCGRKPKLAARGDEPSRMSAAPLSTLTFQSAAAGVPEGATIISADAGSANMWPTEVRIAGQGPGCEPRTVKVPAEHRGARASRITAFRNLFCDRI